MKILKKIGAALIVSAFVFHTFFGAAVFPNASDWALKELQDAADYGLLEANLFDDYSKNTTRAEFCQLAIGLYETLSGKAASVPAENPFTDTNQETVLKAYQAGIVKGTSDVLPTTFQPDNPITREQQAVMIANVIQACGYSTTVTGTGKEFADANQISSWALPQVRFLRSMKIMNGNDKNQVQPKAYVTREQSVLLVKRTFETYYGGVDVSTPEKQLLKTMNLARAKEGLVPFAWSDAAASVAKAHSMDMAQSKYNGSKDSKGLEPMDRLKLAGIDTISVGEAISAGVSGSAAAASEWTGNKEIMKLILSDQYTHVGIGSSMGSGGYYFTADFYVP